MSNILSFTSGNRLWCTHFRFWFFFLNGTANLKIHRLLISRVTYTLKQIVYIFKIYCMYYNFVQNCFPFRKMVSGEIFVRHCMSPVFNNLNQFNKFDKLISLGEGSWMSGTSQFLFVLILTHVNKCDKINHMSRFYFTYWKKNNKRLK